MRASLSVLLATCTSSAIYSQAQNNGGATGGDISLPITPAQLSQTFPGGTKSIIPGAPALPTTTITASNYPPTDQIPPTDSNIVKEWIAKIDMSKVPAIQPTGANGCSNTTFNADAIAKSGSTANCWWSCGGCTRSTDITSCPTKGTWGATFDDGPSEYTPNVLQYLDQHQLKATFFVVGSRVISRPEILRAEYMLGHEICLHTWSHPALTTLTNEQIIAEVAWSMKAVKDVIGVVPQSIRPPYADVDDRVRYILKAMGLNIILWTGTGEGSFDTEDWRVVDGSRTTSAAIQKFQTILSTASTLQTGFIVLAHDLFPQEVALSLRSFLPTALGNANLKIQSINTCLGQPLSKSYIETSGSQNATPTSGSSNTSSTSNSSTGKTSSTNALGSMSTTTNPAKDTASSSSSRPKFSLWYSVFFIGLMLIYV